MAGTSNAIDRHDPSLPYLEQYRIDFEQFKGMFALLFPWACGTHSDVLAARLFRLLDENGDSLINFREFVSGLSAACHGDLTEKLKLLYRMHLISKSLCFLFDLFSVSKKSSQENRNYLRMWSQENKAKAKNAKDLPKLNQGQFIELCKTMYNMFSEDPNEQDLYHATAAVTSLLLEIGEVGKLFSVQPVKEPESNNKAIQNALLQKKGNQHYQLEGQVPFPGAFLADEEENICGDGTQMEDIKLEDSSPRDNGAGSSMLISDDDTKDDSSMSSYSVLSTGSHEEDKLHCEDIGEDTVLVRSNNPASLPRSTSIDRDWAITFEQFLASLLTEPALVRYFDKPVCMMARITNAKNVRMMGKPIISASDYEISAVSG
uniref:EF-hand domain-containing protein n=1 Tax=Salvator merianae TaxID=96440 RepID=A0A8D0KKP8_SALMN